MDNTYITENQYITITEHENNYYTLESDFFIHYGYCKKVDNTHAEIKLDTAFHKPTKTYRKKNTKLFKSDIMWFWYMIEKYAHNYA